MESQLLKSNIQRDIDFSGTNIENLVLTAYDFAESVFNGCHFKNVEFVGCNLSNTEHTETYFLNCTFSECTLNSSDFVYSNLTDCAFSKCTFSHVEWRESEYSGVDFKECQFYNSTVSLCLFRGCSFDNFSSTEIQGSSKRLNAFSDTKLFIEYGDLSFVFLNYGITIPDYESIHPVRKIELDGDFLSKLSLVQYSGQWTAPNFIENITGAISQLGKISSRGTLQKIKYISNICKITTEQGRLTVFSSQVLIERINYLAAQIHQPSLFMELAELILFLKTFQYRRIKEIEDETLQYKALYVADGTIELHLANTYDQYQIEKLIEACVDYQGAERDSIKLLSVTSGSTLITGIITASVSIGGFLMAINFALSQVKKTIVHVKAIKKELGGKKKQKDKKRKIELLPMEIMQSGNTVHYTQINNVVNKYASDLIQIEGKGSVQINVKS